MILSLLACNFLVCGDGTVESGGKCVVAETDDTGTGGVPAIVTFAANVDTLGEGESVIFTAVVVHPDGIDQLVGGTLLSGSGAAYGAFATSGDEGAYSMAVSWWAINQINPIELDPNDDGSRPFKAVFYDVDGESAEASLDVGLTCGGDPSCDGVCGRSCSGGDTGN